MKAHILLMLGITAGIAACGPSDTKSPWAGMETKAADASSESQPTAGEDTTLGSDAFVRHMHFHASQLEWLNDALAAGDIDAARTPAYWLAGHQEVSGVPNDWKPHIHAMREAARDVNDATDIETARAASQRISDGCISCHAAAGVEVTNLQLQ